MRAHLDPPQTKELSRWVSHNILKGKTGDIELRCVRFEVPMDGYVAAIIETYGALSGQHYTTTYTMNAQVGPQDETVEVKPHAFRGLPADVSTIDITPDGVVMRSKNIELYAEPVAKRKPERAFNYAPGAQQPAIGKLSGRDFKAIVADVKATAGHDRVLPAFSSVQLLTSGLEGIGAMATCDRYRLARRSFEWDTSAGSLDDFEVLIPVEIVLEANRLAQRDDEVTIATHDNGVVGIKISGQGRTVEFVSNCLDNEYPRLDHVILRAYNSFNRIDFDVKPLLIEVKKLIRIIGKKEPITLTAAPGEIRLTSGSNKAVYLDNSIKCKSAGLAENRALTLFNASYLLEALTACAAAERAVLTVPGQGKPAGFRRVDQTPYVHVVMSQTPPQDK